MPASASPASFVPNPSKNILVQEVFGELLVYDLERNIVRRLNPVAAAIWKQCDGRKNVAEIARAIAPHLEGQVNEQVVLLALHRFSWAHLLAGPVPEAANAARISRRELIKRIGIAALPLVTSMAVPTAAQAASCAALGQPCSAAKPCCPGPLIACVLGVCVGLGRQR